MKLSERAKENIICVSAIFAILTVTGGIVKMAGDIENRNDKINGCDKYTDSQRLMTTENAKNPKVPEKCRKWPRRGYGPHF